MKTIIDFSILQGYNEEIQPSGDKLLSLAKLVDWDAFLRLGLSGIMVVKAEDSK
jgi:hypothetical protein